MEERKESGSFLRARPMLNVRRFWRVLQQTFAAWNQHEAPRLGAALAFYTIISLAPLMILTIALLAMIFGRSGAQTQILGQVQSMIGEDGASAFQAMAEHPPAQSSSWLGSALGVLTLLFGASGVFGELRSALNKIWEVKPPSSGSGVMGMVRERFFSFGMVLAIGFLLLVSLILSAGLAAFGKFFGGLLPIPEVALSVINFLLSFAAIAVVFSLIFKYVPERTISWNEVWLGGVMTAFLFAVGKSLIGLYLGKVAVGSAYGAAGSLVVVIVWLYYSAQIFFFGAELTHVMADANSSAERG